VSEERTQRWGVRKRQKGIPCDCSRELYCVGYVGGSSPGLRRCHKGERGFGGCMVTPLQQKKNCRKKIEESQEHILRNT